MLWSLVTVLFYSVSSLGDKYISARLRCTAPEFSFVFGLATALFLALLLPLFGWEFAPSLSAFLAVGAVVLLKIVEFYTSALLLRQVSAFELKA